MNLTGAEQARKSRTSTRFIFTSCMSLVWPVIVVGVWIAALYINDKVHMSVVNHDFADQTAASALATAATSSHLELLWGMHGDPVDHMTVDEREKHLARAVELMQEATHEVDVLITGGTVHIGEEGTEYDLHLDLYPLETGSVAYPVLTETACVKPGTTQHPGECNNVGSHVFTRGLRTAVHQTAHLTQRIVGLLHSESVQHMWEHKAACNLTVPQDCSNSSFVQLLAEEGEIADAYTELADMHHILHHATRGVQFHFVGLTEHELEKLELSEMILTGIFISLVVLITFFVSLPRAKRLGESIVSARMLLLAMPDSVVRQVKAVRQQASQLVQEAMAEGAKSGGGSGGPGQVDAAALLLGGAGGGAGAFEDE